MINLITVCTDAYPTQYARILIKRFLSLTELPVKVWCITDRPEEIQDLAETIEPPFGPKMGWWNKMKVYDSFYEGYAVYMDIDTVLVKNFDEEIIRSVANLDSSDYKVACVSDAIGWMNNKYSSSMMVLKSGNMQDIWDTFLFHYHRLKDYKGGDQVWTGQLLDKTFAKVYYIDEEVNPSLKLNLKFHLGEKIFDQWKFPLYIPNDCKIVDCGGKPKPHELAHLSYIKENWHDVI